MYPNIKAEMARRNITLAKLAEYLGVTISTLSLKINGKAPLTWDEAVKIKEYIGANIPMEQLFSKEAV